MTTEWHDSDRPEPEDKREPDYLRWARDFFRNNAMPLFGIPIVSSSSDSFSASMTYTITGFYRDPYPEESE